jgi:signal transduction histidine kinase
LDRVVGSVLDYARPSKGNPGVVDLNAAVTRTIQVLRSNRDQETRFLMTLSDDLPRVRADAEQLRQVLMNLVRNAVEAMGGAGMVTVTTRARTGRPDPDFVEIAVQDTGPGIPPHVLRSLFVPFFTTKHRGTGLGLAISQRMVQEMGGRIEVATQEGLGSIFVVVLPVVTRVAAPRAPASAPPPTAEPAPKSASAPPHVEAEVVKPA